MEEQQERQKKRLTLFAAESIDKSRQRGSEEYLSVMKPLYLIRIIE
jgi:hypothetical protein